MTEPRIARIRQAEAYSHIRAYTQHPLFQSGSWLSKPVKTVLDCVPHFQDHKSFRGLDLGCGVGRNCIPVLQTLPPIPKLIECVVILPFAIQMLRMNAEKYRVCEYVVPIVSAADSFFIKADSYDLIIAVSVLEHLASPYVLNQKLRQLRTGLKPGGIACIITNTSIEEHCAATGEALDVRFEVNLPTEEMLGLLTETFREMEILKQNSTHYQYETYREAGKVCLDTDVVTYVVRRRN